MTDEQSVFAGLECRGVAYCVGRIPGMKRYQLYRMEGNHIWTLAGFRDDAEAAKFAGWIRNLVGTSARWEVSP